MEHAFAQITDAQNLCCRRTEWEFASVRVSAILTARIVREDHLALGVADRVSSVARMPQADDMLTTPFLTDLDSRAAVKGSRDPLGIQSIWTRLGRHVVGNLTTVSDSIRDFTTLLLGYYFAERLSNESGPGSELAVFLRWEQLAAYARAAINEETAFRGTERVWRNLRSSSPRRVIISDDRAQQILGNQKIYGLWGLYTMPARASGLLDGDPTRLTPPATEMVERQYLPLFEDGSGRDARRILDVLRPRSRRIDVDGGDRRLLETVARLLHRRVFAAERDFYRTYLLHGGPQDKTGGLQRQLASLLEGTLTISDFMLSPSSVAALTKEARARGMAELANRLERINTAERVLAPMSMLFSHLLGMDGRTSDDLVHRVRKAWGSGLTSIDSEAFRQLRAEMGVESPEVGDRWVVIAEAGREGRYGDLVDLLIEQNAWVMSRRNGVPWLEKRNGRFHVRFRDEQGELPKRKELANLWRFPYFLDSLRSVAARLKESNGV